MGIMFAGLTAIAQEAPLPPAPEVPELSTPEQAAPAPATNPADDKMKELSQQIDSATEQKKKEQQKQVIENIAEEVFSEKKSDEQAAGNQPTQPTPPADQNTKPQSTETYSITVSGEEAAGPKNELAEVSAPEQQANAPQDKPDENQEQSKVAAPEPTTPLEQKKEETVSETPAQSEPTPLAEAPPATAPNNPTPADQNNPPVETAAKTETQPAEPQQASTPTATPPAESTQNTQTEITQPNDVNPTAADNTPAAPTEQPADTQPQATAEAKQENKTEPEKTDVAPATPQLAEGTNSNTEVKKEEQPVAQAPENDKPEEKKEAEAKPEEPKREIVLEEKNNNFVEKIDNVEAASPKMLKESETEELIPKNIGKYSMLSLPASLSLGYIKKENPMLNQVVADRPSESDNYSYYEANNKDFEIETLPADDFNSLSEIVSKVNEKKSVSLKEDINISSDNFNDPFAEKSPDIQDLAKTKQQPEKAEQAAQTEKKDENFYLKKQGLVVEVKNSKDVIIDMYKNAEEAMNAGLYESAIAYYKKLSEMRPADTRIRFGLATAYHKAGQLDNAKDEYLKIIASTKNSSMAMNNYLILVTEENPDSAIEKLEGLSAKNPFVAAIPAQIGSLYYNKGQLNKAAEYYLLAVNKEPGNIEYRYNLAIILEKLNQKVQAAKLYKSLLDDAARGATIPENPISLRDRYFNLISSS